LHHGNAFFDFLHGALKYMSGYAEPRCETRGCGSGFTVRCM
jgi:hypothetical protein